MKYDFDTPVERRGTGSIKWDFTEKFFSLKDLLPMWVADMDFRSAEPVIKALRSVADHGIFGYAGVPESYCEAVKSWMSRRHSWDIQSDWLVQSPGVVPAIHMLVMAFSSPGDQIILQPPVYFPFFNAVRSNKRRILENPLVLKDGQYYMDFENLESNITDATRMIILCNPHNPISRVWSEQDLTRLGEICIKHAMLVISDEIHEDIVYKGFKHVPFASLSKAFADNSITCTAASKTFNLPGLQTSNIIISNENLRKRFKETIGSVGLGAPNIFGLAATEAAYRYGEEWLKQLLAYLQDNIAFVKDYISRRMPGVRIAEPQGTYLLWLDFRSCGIDNARLGNFIREDAKVGLEPGLIFGCKEVGFERMNIACPRSVLEQGLARIESAVNNASNAGK